MKLAAPERRAKLRAVTSFTTFGAAELSGGLTPSSSVSGSERGSARQALEQAGDGTAAGLGPIRR